MTCVSDALTPAKSPRVARIWSISWDPCAPSHPPPAEASAHHDGTTASGSTRTGTCMTQVAMRGVPDQALADGLGQEGLSGVEAELGPQEVHDRALLRRAEHDGGLGAVAGEGLLAQHVPPGCDGLERQLGVGVRRGGDGDGVHAGKRQRLAEIGGGARAPRTCAARSAVLAGSRPTRARTSNPAWRRARTWV